MSTIPENDELETSRTGLGLLPVEIVAEILRLLDWKDILRTRQTCTLLYSASKSRDIWQNLVQIHSAAAHLRPTVLDKPVHMHTPGQLEERFLRWMKTESTWLDEHPLNENEIPDLHEFQCSHLLRGGRWLICSDFGGEVLYCDLESPETGFVPLIPYPFPSRRGSETMMAVEEDPESETLSFNIALVHMLFADWVRAGQPRVTGESRVDVWSGRVIADEDGESAHLRVEQLASVPLPLYFGRPLSGVSLRGSLVAFTVEWHWFQLGINLCDAIIIDWKEQGRRDSCFRRKTVNYLASFAGAVLKVEVMLLPGNRLLTVPSSRICIYDHSFIPWSSEERRPRVDMSVPDQHACRLRVPGSLIQHPCGFSRVFSLRDNEYRVVFNTLKGIKGLTLHYAKDGGFQATVFDLLDWHEKMEATVTEYRSDFSYNCGVARSKSGYLLRARFAWPDEKASYETGISILTGRSKETPLVINMNVLTGRLSWIADESGQVYISN